MAARRRQFQCVLLLLCALVAPLASCGPRTQEEGGDDRRTTGESPLTFMERPVKFCWRQPDRPWSGGVQILLDSSGSMVGFKRKVPQVVNWLQHSVSLLQTSTLKVANSRLCQFNEGYGQTGGVGNCTELGKSPAGFEPARNTNVHAAINSAKDYGLTMILTDGVAATGGGRSGDCANGVDAACVARALREVVGTQGSEPEGVNWGVWVLPIASNYDGLFYTEEAIAPASFDPRATQQRVREETGAQPVVEKPTAGGDGRLNFTYRGPRMMLLIVIARWADLGRDAVQALWERMGGLGIRRVRGMQDLAALADDVAGFTPIELYPGLTDRLEWKAVEVSEEAGEQRGTMDTYFVPDRQALELSCPPGETASGVVRLSGASPEAARVAGCVDINVLPPFTFELRPARQGEELAQFVQGAEQGESYEKLRLGLTCDMSSPRPCRDNPLAAQWVGLAHYGRAADALASADSGPAAVPRHIKEVSTQRPSAEPHRIYGFADTLNSFYRELSAERQSAVVAELKLCHR